MSTTITKKQVAIVTGAFSGIGLGITQALLQHGYRAVVNSRNTSKKTLEPPTNYIEDSFKIFSQTGIRFIRLPIY
jgi:NAD(P)-dependent dehydrogenase (short-subunit alcohol dehydrogenase family)